MNIEIICPLYNAEGYINNLHLSLTKQKKVNIDQISYVLTESSDGTEKYLKDHQLNYTKIKKKDFSHSLVREKVALSSQADIICFITQDVVIEDQLWLYHLTKDIISGVVDATYSRQLTKYNNIEKYTREYNYPDYDFIKSKKDIEKYGLKTFFFSDAASAIKREVFVELKGYDHKELPTNEDMYFAYKLIMSGRKIKYCADSTIYHSHQFTLKELYERYRLTGKFFKENDYLNQFGTNKSGGGLAKYILKRILQDKRIDLLFRYPFDMAARLIGMKVGKLRCKK